MKYSKAFIKTMKQDIGEAEIVSHKLMHRTSMVRKLASGIYEWLPLGHRVLKKVENIIREEMDKVSAQEISLPALQPKELWEKSGRWEIYGKELVRLKDRHERDFCLGPTHEEVITSLVADIVDSYRQLPFILYQFQTKFRDEIRPRFGIMRSREFLMKDAYSFDVSDESAAESYKIMYQVYENIFKRCGLGFCVVEANSGSIGGNFSHEFMVMADTGESEIASCECGYAANIEKAVALMDYDTPDTDNNFVKKQEMQEILTPDKKTIEEVSEFLNIESKQFIKTLVYYADKDYIVILVRGDRTINEIKLATYLDALDLRLATDEEIMDITGVQKGFLGPIGLRKGLRVIAEESIGNIKNAVSGANKKDYHFININEIDIEEYVDLMLVQEHDKCIKCQKELNFSRGIEVGHIFKLGMKYSLPLGAEFLNDQGKRNTIIMGCYGIGVSRVVAAAVEQNHDDKGIVWPWAIAPYQIGLVCVDIRNKELLELSEKLYADLNKEGYDVLFDDRKERPGVKFNDMELLGVPVMIIVGKKYLKTNQLELKIRKTGEVVEKNLVEIFNFLKYLSF
ncbi:MAG: proline--tRNA ligase [bacterium]|nr:proline--tRNA ligase [bacterium]